MTEASHSIGILYDHPEWFGPLFAELDQRGVDYAPIDVSDPASDPERTGSQYRLVVNRMSPSAWTRGDGLAISKTRMILLLEGATMWAVGISRREAPPAHGITCGVVINFGGISWEPARDAGRLNHMQLRVALIVVAMLLSACTTTNSGNGGDSGETAEMMAVALVELITEDHTFGEGPPPFTQYLVQDRIDPLAGEPTASADRSTRDLSEVERAVIEEAMSEYAPVRWIDDPDQWRTSDLRPTVEGAVIVGVGEPIIQDDTGLVPVSLWCGGRCGTWFTYRLDLVDEAWVVTGKEGPVAIS